MKKILALILAGLLMTLASQAIAAVSLTLETASNTVELGESFSVDLKAVLTDGDVFDWYDISVAYDESILDYTDYTLGDDFGLDTEDFSPPLPGEDGIARVAEYNWSDAAQGPSLLLATLTFEADVFGTSQLAFGDTEVKFGTNEYTEEFGDLVLNGTEVNVVPIPGAVWLLGSGLLGLVGLRRKRK